MAKAKEIKMYEIDNGTGWTTMMGEPTLRHYWKNNINHNIDCGGYPDFEGWLYDMKRHDLIREVG